MDEQQKLLSGPVKISDDPSLAAQQYWLLYLAIIARDAVEAAVCLYLRRLGRQALVFHRQLFESAAKALYFELDCEEARFQLDCLSREQLAILSELSDTPEADLKAAREFYQREAIRNPQIATARRPKTVKSMLKAVDSQAIHSYAYYYRQSSQHWHQTALGLASILEQSSSGEIVGNAEADVKIPNLMLLEMAQLCVVFYRVYQRLIKPAHTFDIDAYDSLVESLIQVSRKEELSEEFE